MKNESGRSMVEMLGVLAIIGVLSVGGIAGYTMAMNKYKANEIASALNQCLVISQAKKATGGTPATADCTDFLTLSGHTISISSNTITVAASGTGAKLATGVVSALTGMGISATDAGATVTIS